MDKYLYLNLIVLKLNDHEKYDVLISNIISHILNLIFIFGRSLGYTQIYISKS
jgi:hypothetical protein